MLRSIGLYQSLLVVLLRQKLYLLERERRTDTGAEDVRSARSKQCLKEDTAKGSAAKGSVAKGSVAKGSVAKGIWQFEEPIVRYRIELRVARLVHYILVSRSTQADALALEQGCREPVFRFARPALPLTSAMAPRAKARVPKVAAACSKDEAGR